MLQQSCTSYINNICKFFHIHLDSSVIGKHSPTRISNNEICTHTSSLGTEMCVGDLRRADSSGGCGDGETYTVVIATDRQAQQHRSLQHNTQQGSGSLRLH